MSLSLSIPSSANPNIFTLPPTTEKGRNATRRLYLWDLRLSSKYEKKSQGCKLLTFLRALHKSAVSTAILQRRGSRCGCLTRTCCPTTGVASPICDHHCLLNSRSARKPPPVPQFRGRKLMLRNENWKRGQNKAIKLK